MNPLIKSTESSTAHPLASVPGSAAADSTVELSGMSRDVFKAAKEGNLDALRGVRLEEELTATKNTVLHVYLTCSSSQKNSMKNEEEEQNPTNIVKEILRMCPSLLMRQNKSGDTALHIAARHGHAPVVKLFIEEAKVHHDHSDLEQGMKEEANDRCLKMMIRTTNSDNDTALHVAVRFNNSEEAHLLTCADPEFSYPPNKAGETPLYIAAERGYTSLVRQMFDKCTHPVYGGPNGRTALHAAVIRHDIDMTRMLLEKEKTLAKVSEDLLGVNPLHIAADNGRTSIVRLLLESDRSVAYTAAEKDEKMTALHYAAHRGHVKVMQELIRQCPDCSDLVDSKHRNVLHHAIKSHKPRVVEYILADAWLSTSLLNGKDVDGNTPFHLLAERPCYMPTNNTPLLQHAKVDLMAFNGNNLNAFDIILANKGKIWLPFSWEILMIFLWLKGVKPYRRIHKRHKDGNLRDKQATEEIEIAQAKETHLVVATLIATVSFAAGMAMPGGYGEHGSAILTSNAAFKAFIITNTIAMAMSSCSVMVLLYSSIHTKASQNKMTDTFQAVVSLTMLSLIAMVLAFITGTYAVLDHSLGLATPACVLGCYFFFVIANSLMSGERKIRDAPHYLQDMIIGILVLILKPFIADIIWQIEKVPKGALL